MSKENAQKFISMMQQDEKLKARVEKITGKYSSDNFTKEAAEKLIDGEIRSIAKEKGLDFTFAELNAGQMSDEELDKVVGGITDGNGNWVTMCYFCCDQYTAAKPEFTSRMCSTCCHWDYESANETGSFSYGITVPMMFFKPGTCHAKH